MSLARSYPIPANEPDRLDELERYAVLDTPAETVFDDVVRLARSLFGAECSLISFVADDRQWFKARSGFGLQETRREDAFCTHTIAANAVLVVPDARCDSRFSSNALVVRAPYIRFYAGVPLRTPRGLNIGSVCVIDSAPRRDFRAHECEQLERLAAIVMAELTRRVSHYQRRLDGDQLSPLRGQVSGYGITPQEVEIVSISARGAMIRGPKPALLKGDELILTIGKMVVVSKVTWTKDTLEGIAFHCPIDPRLVARLNGKITQASGVAH
ncbi:GAF domain-containing protein [Sphingomonas sp. RB3P16]|uniref:GAF domain-containing protein n=1 Tax=Parasphingomonas frigoris TaxID=3096163 RepID=UPI002FC6C815